MRPWIGTSGWSYDAWKGGFYPEKIGSSDMLGYYAERLPAVEVNNTFYRLPKRDVLEGWGEQVSDGHFRFVLKASRRITHQAKLAEGGYDALDFLTGNREALGAAAGPILFQTPPWLKKDTALLEAFLDRLPDELQAAFEFRSTSWFEDDVFDALRSRDAALVTAETEEPDKDPPFVSTAGWGYLRLRKPAYEPEEVEAWAERIGEQDWTDAYVFFKHEDEGTGPRLAGRMLELLGGRS
ncbi:MAG TPA: DUF72 domain-containing protein [Longimicrobiales bacterium]|nr:DUF72 domain-containing protein [Longimicrobiales bacterium]